MNNRILAVLFGMLLSVAFTLTPKDAFGDEIPKGSASVTTNWQTVIVGYGKKVCFNTIGTSTVTVLYKTGNANTAKAADGGITQVGQVQFPGDCYKIQLQPQNDRISFYVAGTATIDVYELVP